MKALTIILPIAFVLSSVLAGTFFYQMQQTNREAQADKAKNDILNNGLRISQQEELRLHNEVAFLNDSIMSLNTQKGWLEIQLNKKEASLTATATKYLQAKEKHDTIAQVIYCDTLVMNGEKYLSSNQLFRAITDSLLMYRLKLTLKQDTITKIDSTAINKLTDALADCQQQKAKDEKKVQKAQKGGLIMGIIGWAVGAVVYIFK